MNFEIAKKRKYILKKKRNTQINFNDLYAKEKSKRYLPIIKLYYIFFFLTLFSLLFSSFLSFYLKIINLKDLFLLFQSNIYALFIMDTMCIIKSDFDVRFSLCVSWILLGVCVIIAIDLLQSWIHLLVYWLKTKYKYNR